MAETDDPAADLSQTLSGSYLAGRFARSENDTDNAARFYSNALVFDPSSDMLYEQALLAEASQGAWDRAMRLSQSLVKMEPTTAWPRCSSGSVHSATATGPPPKRIFAHPLQDRSAN